MRTIASALLAALCVLAGCIDDPVGETALAIDTDGNGVLDCADLDHVLTCVHHPGAPGCVHADVTGDGVVDLADVHAVTEAILASGHHCDGHHDVDHAGYHHPDSLHGDMMADHDDGHPGDPTDPHQP
ncbi:MAG TPA: hypothetical protein VHE35_22685 [Kofleriaceae bacterium]|nr:hypothetical protein [Kofleriaceae bacterium]